MTTPKRLWYEGASYHITARGNHRNDIFRDEEDFQYYLTIAEDALFYYGNYNHQIICYCLMDNDLKLTNTDIDSIWNEQRYLELIMGETPRLKDDFNGYVPCGKNFIVHVDVSKEIEEHYNMLKALVNDDNLSVRRGF